MAIKKIRVSELPISETLQDTSTLSYKEVAGRGVSHQVPLNFVQIATDNANLAAENANLAATTIDAKIDSRVPSIGEVGAVLTKRTPANKWELLKESVTPTELELTVKQLIKHLAPNGKIVLKNGDTLQGLPFRTAPTDVYDFSQMTISDNLFREMPYLESLNDFDFSKMTSAVETAKNCPKLIEFVNHTTGNIINFRFIFEGSGIKHADLNTSGAINLFQPFWNCKELVSVALLDATNWVSAATIFDSCPKLTDIAGFKNLSCRIAAYNCNAITPESVLNIATHAKDMTGLTAITFSFMKVVITRTPEATLQMFTDKNIIIKTY